MRPPCKFHSSPGGCRNGDACRFSHGSSGGESNRAQWGGRGRGRGGVSSSSGGRGFGASNSATQQLLAQLGCSLDPPANVVQRLVHLALAQCDREQAHWVLKDLKSTDGCQLLRAAALQLTQPEVRARCFLFLPACCSWDSLLAEFLNLVHGRSKAVGSEW
jgi:hypothetical protein